MPGALKRLDLLIVLAMKDFSAMEELAKVMIILNSLSDVPMFIYFFSLLPLLITSSIRPLGKQLRNVSVISNIISCIYLHIYLYNEILFFPSLDLNECTINPGRCGLNGVCRNTIGSFVCDCVTGYRWNGTTCVGMQFIYQMSLILKSNVCRNKKMACNHPIVTLQTMTCLHDFILCIIT